jgi:adenine deaminase
MDATTVHRGQIVDIGAARTFPGIVEVREGRVVAVRVDASVTETTYLAPGFVDAHVHVESSMLTPREFGRLALVHGTVATVSDPHEIANVLGLAGVRYMQAQALETPCKLHFGIPSCVPATRFETAGADLGPQEVAILCEDPSLRYLSEMMNFPGVIARDPEVMEKIRLARQHGKRIDGHAPGLRGEALARYVAAGIETDHECFQIDEAREKQALGQKILVREGSAAKNFEALWPLLNEHPESCMLCTDDLHPDDLLEGHINRLAARAVARGVPWPHVLRVACVNPVEHYGLRSGLLRPGDPADFVRLGDLERFEVLETWVDGNLVARGGVSLLPRSASPVVNHFHATRKSPADFVVAAGDGDLRVIEAIDGELVTNCAWMPACVRGGQAVADPDRDLLKLSVVNRYRDAKPAVAFVRGVGLRGGAIASSVAHDCHNLVAVGDSEESICRAVNRLIDLRGGIAWVGQDASGAWEEDALPLPVAGLMSDGFAEDVAAGYQRLTRLARASGSTLRAPYMTLSFLALLVIPTLKLSDLGLFDGREFQFVELFGGKDRGPSGRTTDA